MGDNFLVISLFKQYSIPKIFITDIYDCDECQEIGGIIQEENGCAIGVSFNWKLINKAGGSAKIAQVRISIRFPESEADSQDCNASARLVGAI